MSTDPDLRHLFPRVTWRQRLRGRWHRLLIRAGQWYRRKRGIIGLNFSACRCLKCGRVDAYHRAGCRCWDMFSDDPAQVMEYGWFLENPENGSGYASNADIQRWVIAGRHVQWPDGSRIGLEDCDGAGEVEPQ